MKVNLTLDVSDSERYVIARYYRPVDKMKRTRASRYQVRKFVRAALLAGIRERLQEMDLRTRRRATKLMEPVLGREVLPVAKEKELVLPW